MLGTMKISAIAMALLLLAGSISIALCGLAAPAQARAFVFDETSASVPGLVIDASITMKDSHSLADLPTINNQFDPAPYDFGDLQALEVKVPDLSDQSVYTLADFVAPCSSGGGISCITDFPDWSISPGEIAFINAADAVDFFIKFFPTFSTIQFDTDGYSNPSDCGRTGACIATDKWIPAPESASIFLLLAGIFGTYFVIRRRRFASSVCASTRDEATCAPPPKSRMAPPPHRGSRACRRRHRYQAAAMGGVGAHQASA
jgi:hypothetical protein